MSKVLVLSEKALFYKADLNRDFAAIKIAQTCFGLGFDLDFDGLEIEVNACVGALQTPCLGGVQDLLFIALARLNPAERAQLPDVGDPFVGSNPADIWLDLGFDEIGAIVQAWLDLAEEVIVEVHHPGTEDAYPDVGNKQVISRKINKLSKKLDPLLEEVQFDFDEIQDIICERFNLALMPFPLFQKHWIEQIITAPGFATYAPDASGEGWPLADEPFGWLTKRHGAALAKHGYDYKFAFWQEEIGETRGHLWVQTNKGPIVLTDKTDAVSLRSHFPVQVSSLSGKRLFKLKERDVPDDLMGRGPDIPKELSARTGKTRKPSGWKAFLPWLR